MTRVRLVVLAVGLVVMTVMPVAAQDPPPAGPFRAVHLVSLTPDQVAAVQAWMADMNAAIRKAGHKDVSYRLYKVIGKPSGKYDFMWESSWPSGDVYTKIHSMPEWKTVGDKHSARMSEIMKDEIYNRYVEVMPEKRP